MTEYKKKPTRENRRMQMLHDLIKKDSVLKVASHDTKSKVQKKRIDVKHLLYNYGA